MNKKDRSLRKIAFRGGVYSLAVIAIILAILITVNIFASVLPTTVTKLDMSSSQLYSVTSDTKVVLNSLDKDVTIYWIVQADSEDSIISNLLSKYESLSEHITVTKINPDVYPTFTQQYTDETASNNSLIVASGDKSRYIDYYDIYLVESNGYSYSYSDFDGEGQITSAIDYVVSEELPKMYVLEGHGEPDLPDTFAGQIEKENIETESLSLVSTGEVPEDASCVLIYAPESDISESELDVLREYISNGGKLMVVSGAVEAGTLTTLTTLLKDYGIEPVEGFVLETDSSYYGSYYGMGLPYLLLPNMTSNDITDPLIEERYYVNMPIAQGLDVSNANTGVTALLISSDTSFSKTDGYNFETYDMEEDDTPGSFALAVTVETDGDGEMIWFSSSLFLEESYNSFSSGANVNIAMNALSELIGEREALAIRSKSLGYTYLSIDSASSSLLEFIMIAAVPILFLGIGIVVVLMRRRVQNGEG